MSETTTSKRQAPVAVPVGEGHFSFDRLIVWLLLFAVAVVAAMVFLFTIGLFSLAETLPDGAVFERWLRLEQLPYGSGRFLVGAISLLVGLIASVLLLRRVVPGGSRTGEQHVLLADDLGVVVVEKKGIAAVAVAAVQRVNGVVDVEVRVIGSGAAPLRLIVRTWVHAAAELKRAGDEVRQKAKEAVEHLIGIEVHDVLVKLEVVPLEDLGRIVE
jgi:hypothetical protein